MYELFALVLDVTLKRAKYIQRECTELQNATRISVRL